MVAFIEQAQNIE